MKRRWLLVLALAACDSGVAPPPPPVPGTVTVDFTTPNTNDRAVLLTVRGAGISAVTAAVAAYDVRFRVRGDTARVAIFGNLQGGAAVRFNVPDLNKLNAYQASLVEVADDGNQLRSSLAAYAIRLMP
jgi:hypothetical protein